MRRCISENWRNRLVPATKFQRDSMMRKLITWSLFVFLLIQLSAPPASAEIITLQPGSEGFDTRLSVYFHDTPLGNGEALISTGNEYDSTTYSSSGVSLLRFVLPSPLDDPRTTIDSATLKLHLHTHYNWSGADSSDLGVAGVMKTWDESTATWDNFVSTPYNDSDQTSTDTVSISDVPKPPPYGPNIDIWLEWDVRSLVSDWVSGSRTNYGFMVRADNDLNRNEFHFHSSDYGTAEYRPILEIQFTPIPEPGTLTLAAFGALVLLPCALRRRRKR